MSYNPWLVMELTNRWNRLIYWLWSPIYDRLARFFRAAREREFQHAAIVSGERVLLVGVGTGLDLPLLPPGARAVGVDLSRAMLERARKRLPLRGREVLLVHGDALCLPFRDGFFDVAILTLILSVVPDGATCLRETIRVLRPGGRAIIFDKFLPADVGPSLPRRLLNVLTSFFGTDINRRLEDMLPGLDCSVEREEPGLFGGAYKVFVVRRGQGPGSGGSMVRPPRVTGKPSVQRRP